MPGRSSAKPRRRLAFHLIRIYETDRVFGMLSGRPVSETEKSVDWGRVFGQVPATLRGADERDRNDVGKLARELLDSDDPRDEAIVGLIDQAFSRGFDVGRDFAEHDENVLRCFADLVAVRDKARANVERGRKRRS